MGKICSSKTIVWNNTICDIKCRLMSKLVCHFVIILIFYEYNTNDMGVDIV